MYEEDLLDDVNIDKSSDSDNSFIDDVVGDNIVSNLDQEEEEQSEVEASTQTLDFDYSYIQRTNDLLSVLVILFVAFMVMYAFNQLKHLLERLGL